MKCNKKDEEIRTLLKKFEESETEHKKSANQILKDAIIRLENEICGLQEKSKMLECQVKEKDNKLEELKGVMLKKEIVFSDKEREANDMRRSINKKMKKCVF